MIRIKQFGVSYRAKKSLITDKGSIKVCIFLSVLMASLFITNCGDIICELVRGGEYAAAEYDFLRFKGRVRSYIFILCPNNHT